MPEESCEAEEEKEPDAVELDWLFHNREDAADEAGRDSDESEDDPSSDEAGSDDDAGSDAEEPPPPRCSLRTNRGVPPARLGIHEWHLFHVS